MNSVPVVDIDVGNTRLKWCLRHAGAPVAYAASGDGEPSRQVEMLAAAVAGQGVAPGRVRVASVADDASNRDLVALLQQAFAVEPELAHTTAECRGLRNSYAEPGNMGVDRWLAMLAARELAPASPLCVIDAGSALTLDFIGADGQHVGGFILPGRRMQVDALLARTGRVFADPEPESDALQPANNTSDAVHHGVIASMVYTIEGACRAFTASHPQARILLGGGDAARLQPLLPVEVIAAPNLVLDGLPLLLP